jgi:O-antigen/teichoic acid export membrane protein
VTARIAPFAGSALTRRLAPLASPFAVGVAARAGGQIIAFALVVVASRHLGLDAFGTYAVAWAGAVIATSFVYTGFYHALLRADDLEACIDTLFWVKTAVGGAGAAILAAAGLVVGGPGGAIGAALFAVAPLPLLAVPTAWNEAQLWRAGRARAASLQVLAGEAAGLAAAVAALDAGMGLWGLILSRYVASLTGLAVTTAMVRRCPRARFGAGAARMAGRTAWPLWGTTGIGMFSAYGADLVLAAFLTPAAVGAYRSGARIAVTASDVVLQPLRMLGWSRLARLEREGDRSGIARSWRGDVALACAMLWPASAGLALLAEPLVVLVFDPSWAAAAPVLAVLALARALSVPMALMEPALMCTGRGALQFRLRLASGVALLLALLTLGRFGPVEAAWAVMISTGAMSLVCLAVVARVLGLSARAVATAFLPGAGLAALCGGSVFALAPLVAPLPPLPATLAHIVLGAALWAAGVALLFRLKALALPRV